MKITSKITIIAIITSLCFCFSAFGAGMGAIKYTDKEMVLCFEYDDGTFAKNEWKQAWENWYYFNGEGESYQNTWAEIEGKWYYFDQWSVMQHNTTTPDGYAVGSDGVWIQ
jgi:hypothetical protein